MNSELKWWERFFASADLVWWYDLLVRQGVESKERSTFIFLWRMVLQRSALQTMTVLVALSLNVMLTVWLVLATFSAR